MKVNKMRKTMLAALGISVLCFAQIAAAQGPWTSGSTEVTLSGGTLTIRGNGAMADYVTPNNIPWYDYRNSITEAVIEDGVTSIGNIAFQNCENLTSVDIPNSVTAIGWAAFSGSGLTSVVIPQSVTSIPNTVFFNCKDLTSVTIPEGVTSIGVMAFGNAKLTSINIPNSVITIGQSAFTGNSFTSLTIPNSVITIGQSAFGSCKNLISVTIGNSAASIASDAFSGSDNLTSIEVAPDNANLSSNDNVIFNKNKTTLLLFPDARQGIYTIPGSVDSIADNVFLGTKLSSIIIPASVASIGYTPHCASLTSIISMNPVPPAIKSVTYHRQNIALYVPQNSIEAYRSQWEGPQGSEFKYIKAAFTVTFDSQEGSAVSPQYAGEGNLLTKPEDPTLANHTFAGWFWNKDAECNSFGDFICLPPSLDEWDFNNDTVTKDITLYAIWEPSASVLASPRANSSITPAVSVRGRTLNVKLPSSLQSSQTANLQIRMIDMRGRTVSNFKITNGIDNSFSLAKVPAGRYIVEVRNAGKRVNSTPVMVR